MEEITKKDKTWFEYDYDYSDYNYGNGGYPSAIVVKMAEEYLYDFDKRIASVEFSIDNLNDAIVTLKKSVTSMQITDVNNMRLNICNYFNSSDMNLRLAFAELLMQMKKSSMLQPILKTDIDIISVIDSHCKNKFQTHSDNIVSLQNTLNQALGLLKTITTNYESQIQDLNSKIETLELKLVLLED